MKKVALVSSKKWCCRILGDIALQEELCRIGIEAQIVSWEDSIDWTMFDLVLLRSPWDYYEHYSEFCTWLGDLKKSQIHLANGVDKIRNNIDKGKQMEILKFCKVPLLPYSVCTNIEAIDTFYRTSSNGKLVVKPTVSAGGHHVFLINLAQVEAYNQLMNVAKKIMADGFDVIAQPYIPTIKNGEHSLIYFYGQFSHALLRFPGILGEKRAPVPLEKLDVTWIEAGQIISKYLNAEELLYLRIDLVEFQGKIHIMEIEMAEPDLYLHLDYSRKVTPLIAFAEAIAKTIE